MNFKLFLVLYLFFFSTAFAQNRQLDSLRLIIKNAKHDTTRAATMVNFSKEVYNFNPDTVIPVCKSAIEFIDHAKALNQKEERSFASTKSLAYSNMGFVYLNQGRKDLAFKNWTKSLEIREKIGDKNGIAILYNNFGYVYSSDANPAKAIEYFLKCLKINEELGSKIGITLSLHNIASEFRNIGDYSKALDYYQKNLKIQNEIHDKNGMAYSYNNIALIYYRYGNPKCIDTKQKCDSLNILLTFDYFEKSLNLFYHINYLQGVCMVLNNLGEIYQKRGDIDCDLSTQECLENGRKIAILKFKESLKLSRKIKSKNSEASALIKLADCLFEQGDINDALVRAKEGYVIAKNIGEPDLLKSVAQVLELIYTKKGDDKNALLMYKLFVQMRDSMSNIESQKAVIRNQYKYEYGKKATVDSLKTVKDKEVYSIQIEKDKNQKIFLYIIIFLTIIFTLFIFNRFKASQKQKEEIQFTNQKLKNANHDLNRQHLLNQKIFSVISHDFRGPILSLTLMLESFKTKSTDKYLNQFVNEVNAEVLNANEMLNNLLNWARTEINIRDFEKHNCLVFTVYSETIKEFESKLKQKNLEMNVSIPSNAEMNLPPDILKIALRNLLSNAIKFSYSDKSIELIFDIEKQQLDMIDFGVGINNETLEKLFKQEVDTGLGTNNEEGFGMGLYLLSELLRKYGYTIIASNELAGETRFSIITK